MELEDAPPGFTSRTMTISNRVSQLRQSVTAATAGNILFDEFPYLIVSSGVNSEDIVNFMENNNKKCIIITTYSSSYNRSIFISISLFNKTTTASIKLSTKGSPARLKLVLNRIGTPVLSLNDLI